MSGFKSETQAGVRSAFGGLAEIVGVAFGAKQAFDFGKAIVGDAASFQKQIEGIKAQFGSASQEVTRFGTNAAHSLGISAQTADTVSARFGILFRNIGLGQKLSAGMTVGFEKLAGSLAAIKGVDPTEALQAMVLAAAGNVRGLKQLGISIDQNQIKIAALKLGLISNIKDGLTPGIRAQAIYALATANLGAFQDQARKHAGDLANVQRRLSAEWSNAKGILGDALLPTFTKLARELEKWLNHMVKSGRLQHDFNKIAATTKKVIDDVTDAIRTGWKIFKTATGWLGGTKQAAMDLLGVLAVSKFVAIGRAMVVNVVQNGVQILAREFQVAEAEVVASFTGMELAAIGFRTTLQAALISTGIGILVVGLGIAVAEIIAHWSTVKRWLTEFADWVSRTAQKIWKPISTYLGPLVSVVTTEFGAIKGTVMAFVHFFGTVFTHPVRAVENLFHDLANVMRGVFKGMERTALDAALAIVEPFSHLPGFLGGGAFRSMKSWLQGQLAGLEGVAQKSAGIIAGTWGLALSKGLEKAKPKLTSPFGTPNASIDTTAADAAIKSGTAFGKHFVQGATDTVKAGTDALAKSMADSMAQAVANAQQRIADSVIAAKKNLDKIGQELADSINRFRKKLGGGPGSLSSPAQKQLNGLIQDIATGIATPDLVRRATALQNQISASQNVGTDAADAIKRHFADLTDQFRRGSLTLPQFHKRIAELLKANGLNYKTAGKVLGAAFADGYKAQVGGLFEQAKAIAALPKKDRRIGDKTGEIAIVHPLQVIAQENKRIATLASRQRERMIKAQERAAKAAEKSAALAKQEANTPIGTLPGAKKARDSSRNRHGH